jgi:preprotein translocase subunit SecA
MFTAMMDGIKEDSVGSLFNLQVQVQENPIMAEDGAGGVAGGPVISLTQTAPAPVIEPRDTSRPVQQAQPSQQARPARPRQQDQPRQQPSGPPQRPAAAADGEQNVPPGLARGPARPQRQGNLSYSAPSEDATGRAEHTTAGSAGGQYANVGRNAPCPCGSGRKFKMCHGDPRNR